jgi:anti-sigma B factor antagonist
MNEVASPFHVEFIRPAPHIALLEVAGELDLETSAALKQLLGKAIAAGAKNLVVDLASVSFIDSTALGVRVHGVRLPAMQGREMTIVCADNDVARILEITGLGQVFAVFEARAKASRGAEA